MQLPKAQVRDPNRWRQIEAVFNEAVEKDAASRSAFLEQACGSDAELRQEVESLLGTLESSAPFIESAVEDAAAYYLRAELPETFAEGTCFAQYRIIRALGAGGMGRVYVAEDTRLHRSVALKLLPIYARQNGDFLRRFEREARLLCSINHPNVVTVFDFFSVDGLSFLVTELVEGVTLRQKLESGPLPVDEALDIAVQAGKALKATHDRGVIHRDIKPENLMIRSDGCVKVLDFGIAKFYDEGLNASSLTAVNGTERGSLLGTPRYMSPEQVRGLPVDFRTDIFSLGTVLYEMLTGRPPFAGETQSDLIADILRGHPKSLASRGAPRSRTLQPIVDRCLEKDAAYRYRSMGECLGALTRARPYERRSLIAWSIPITAVVALLCLIAFGFYKYRQIANPTPPRSLAVLPFQNLRPSTETDFLAFSLADEVISKLGYIKALVIRPPSAVAPYRNAAADHQNLQNIAEKLNAQMLLTGTYLKDDAKLHITARLTRFPPETIVWQNNWTVPYDDLRSVQDSVAQMIIQGLALELGSDEKQLLKQDRGVTSLAYEYYLRGVDLYAVSDFAAAIAMLENSAAIDPKYAPTWAYLGRAYTTHASLLFGGQHDYTLAEQAYDKAIALNPALPEPRVYMANLLTDTGRVEQAVRLLQVALHSSPNNAEAHWELGYAYRFGGMLKESEQESELARRLDPEVKINSSALNTYIYLGEYDKFLHSLPPNDSPYLVFYHAYGHYYKHDLDEARSDFDRAFELAPGLLQAQIGKALSDGLKHQPAVGLNRLRETERNIATAGVTDAEGLYKVAQAYAVLGDNSDAVRVLDRSVDGGFFCYPYIASDPLTASLRPNPGFQEILNKARVRWRQFRQRFASDR